MRLFAVALPLFRPNTDTDFLRVYFLCYSVWTDGLLVFICFKTNAKQKDTTKVRQWRRCVCFDLKQRLILFNTRYCTRLDTTCLKRIKRSGKYPGWRPGNFGTFALFLAIIYRATSSGMSKNCRSLVYRSWQNSPGKGALEEEDEEKTKQSKSISKFYICFIGIYCFYGVVAQLLRILPSTHNKLANALSCTTYPLHVHFQVNNRTTVNQSENSVLYIVTCN